MASEKQTAAVKPLWKRLTDKLKPTRPEPDRSVTLPVIDSFDPDSHRMTEIRYGARDEDN